jgi:threonine/homoserine efflux transporter RhtA
MDWYNAFNAVEAGLWFVVAAVIAGWTPCATRQQRAAVWLACVSFALFGLTDLLEIGRAGAIPLWLWGLKIACGSGILAARYTWRGWRTFRWRDREFLFGVGCLTAVGMLIVVQRGVEPCIP